MKRIVNFFAPESYDPSKEMRTKKQKPVAQRGTSFFARVFQHLAGTYTVMSQISSETETFLEAEEQKNRSRQREKSEKLFNPQNRPSLLDYQFKVPEHILVRRVQNM